MKNIRISATISGDYDRRGVFGGFDGWPEVPAFAGSHELDDETAKAVIDDAIFQSGEFGPDEMPANIKRAYAALAKQ